MALAGEKDLRDWIIASDKESEQETSCQEIEKAIE